MGERVSVLIWHFCQSFWIAGFILLAKSDGEVPCVTPRVTRTSHHDRHRCDSILTRRHASCFCTRRATRRISTPRFSPRQRLKYRQPPICAPLRLRRVRNPQPSPTRLRMTDSIELAMLRAYDYSTTSVDRPHCSKARNKHTPDALPDNIVADNRMSFLPSPHSRPLFNNTPE